MSELLSFGGESLHSFENDINEFWLVVTNYMLVLSFHFTCVLVLVLFLQLNYQPMIIGMVIRSPLRA